MHNYIPITEDDEKKMLEQIGVNSIDDLFSDIPEEIKLNRKLNLPKPMSEIELKRYFEGLSRKNGTDCLCFRGAGSYQHYIPSVVEHMISRSEFYTAYTPYQPEISQGVLQAIFEYQTYICELTGMDVSNASVYDGATAAAEAAFMAVNITGKSKILISMTVNPEIRKVVKTYCKAAGIEVIEAGYEDGLTDVKDVKSRLDGETAALVVQSPNFFGCLESCKELFELASSAGALSIMSADPISLGILKSPSELGADIAVGDGQPLGNPLNFGGPYLGYMAVHEKLMRRLPGRIVGETVDRDGKRGFVLTLQAREQHIRREKAASNICSNQALNALAAAVYLSVAGKNGIREIAELCQKKSLYAMQRITGITGSSLAFDKPFFREFVIKTGIPADRMNTVLLEEGIIGGYEVQKEYPELENHLLFCVTETKTRDDIDKLVEIIAETKGVVK